MIVGTKHVNGKTQYINFLITFIIVAYKDY